MAVLGPPLAYARRVALRGAYHITLYRGRIVATAWPRQHRARPKRTELERRDWLRAVILAQKHADPDTTKLLREITANSPTYARDLHTMLIAGTALSWRRADGREMLPIRYRRRLEAALDQIRTAPTGLPARHANRWITIAPGPPGSILTSRGPGQTPTWT